MNKNNNSWFNEFYNVVLNSIRELRIANNGRGLGSLLQDSDRDSKLTDLVIMIAKNFLSHGFTNANLLKLYALIQDANASDTFKVVDGKEVITHHNPTLNYPEETSTDSRSDEEKYIEVISSLRALGFTKEEIEKGINALNEDKYKTFDVHQVLNDIIDNINAIRVEALDNHDHQHKMN